jgi:hypothetical protein
MNDYTPEEGIKITDSHLKIFTREYPLEDIKGAFVIKHTPSYLGPLLVLAMGLLFSIVTWWVGLPVIVLAVTWYFTSRSIYGLELVLPGKQLNVLYHKDAQLMNDLHVELLKRTGPGPPVSGDKS